MTRYTIAHVSESIVKMIGERITSKMAKYAGCTPYQAHNFHNSPCLFDVHGIGCQALKGGKPPRIPLVMLEAAHDHIKKLGLLSL